MSEPVEMEKKEEGKNMIPETERDRKLQGKSLRVGGWNGFNV